MSGLAYKSAVHNTAHMLLCAGGGDYVFEHLIATFRNAEGIKAHSAARLDHSTNVLLSRGATLEEVNELMAAASDFGSANVLLYYSSYCALDVATKLEAGGNA